MEELLSLIEEAIERELKEEIAEAELAFIEEDEALPEGCREV